MKLHLMFCRDNLQLLGLQYNQKYNTFSLKRTVLFTAQKELRVSAIEYSDNHFVSSPTEITVLAEP